MMVTKDTDKSIKIPFNMFTSKNFNIYCPLKKPFAISCKALPLLRLRVKAKVRANIFGYKIIEKSGTFLGAKYINFFA